MSSKLVFYNTLSRCKEEFKPIENGVAKMYACGPTVYNYAHIGNLRTYIFEDVLKKTLKLNGYKVLHVMNITDVGHLTGDGDDGEDKIGKAARERKKSVQEIAEFYTDAFMNDVRELNIELPDVICKASEHIGDMIELIKRLEKGGHTYVSNGNVYFSIDTIGDYGKLARLRLDDLQSGKRVGIDSAKTNPNDFVLWFTKSKFQNQAMKWDSPWGEGYPGWHIECSAMSMKYLGEHFDIHCGGVDAIPVHHTNEIAQSEAATGKKWVNYWLHGEFLLSEKGKMSKSSGEFTTLFSLKNAGIAPLAYRYFCLQSHYRKQLQFSEDALRGCQTALNGLYEKVARIVGNVKDRKSFSSDDAKALAALEDEFDGYLYDDLSTSRAVSLLNKVIGSSEVSDALKKKFVEHADAVFSLDLLSGCEKKVVEIPDEVRALADERAKAKKAKDFASADSIRNKIMELGFSIKDTAGGYELSRIC